VDANGARDECACRGRRSRAVLMPQRWHQVGGKAMSAPTGPTRCAGDRGKKARSPGRPRRKPLKPSAQGRPACSGEPVVDLTRVLFQFAREAMGATGTRLSLRPLLEGAFVFTNSGAHCVARRRNCALQQRFPATPANGQWPLGLLLCIGAARFWSRAARARSAQELGGRTHA